MKTNRAGQPKKYTMPLLLTGQFLIPGFDRFNLIRLIISKFRVPQVVLNDDSSPGRWAWVLNITQSLSKQCPNRKSHPTMFSWLGKDPELHPEVYGNVVDGLKGIYKSKLVPLEQHYLFNEFHSPPLSDADFDAQPLILLVSLCWAALLSWHRSMSWRSVKSSNSTKALNAKWASATEVLCWVNWSKRSAHQPDSAAHSQLVKMGCVTHLYQEYSLSCVF